MSLDPIAVLRVLDTLPDSFSARKVVLQDLNAALPDDHSVKGKVELMLVLLKQHETLQNELPVITPTSARKDVAYLSRTEVLAIIRRLPDSLRRRQAVIEDTIVALPHNSALRRELNEVIVRLYQHSIAVRSFLDRFSNGNRNAR